MYDVDGKFIKERKGRLRQAFKSDRKKKKLRIEHIINNCNRIQAANTLATAFEKQK